MGRRTRADHVKSPRSGSSRAHAGRISSSRGTASSSATAFAHDDADAMAPLGLSLQSTVGNRAVARLLEPAAGPSSAPRTAAVPVAREADGDGGGVDFWEQAKNEERADTMQTAELLTADADASFNPDSIVNDLRRAIDQSDPSPGPGKDIGGGVFMPTWVRHVDVAKVIGSLDDLTLKQVSIVDKLYTKREGRPLATDLLGTGESGLDSSLNIVQRQRVSALLRGTKASAPGGTKDRAAIDARVAADAAEMVELLFGGLKTEENRERVMRLHRRPLDEIHSLDMWYTLNTFGRSLPKDLDELLKGLDQTRMHELRKGDVVAADAAAIEKKRLEVDAYERLAPIDFEGKGRAAKKKDLADIEQIVERNRREAMDEASDKGQLASPAVQARMGKLLGSRPDGGDDTLGTSLTKTFGASTGAALNASANENTMQAHARELMRMEEEETTSSEKIATILRSIRAEATSDFMAGAMSEHTTDAERKAMLANAKTVTTALAKQYINQFKQAYNTMKPEDGRSYEKIVDSATSVGQDMLGALSFGGGEMDDYTALVVAVDRKDGEAIKGVLARQKTREAVSKLESRYDSEHDVSLRSELFGRQLTGDAFGALDATVRTGRMATGGIFSGHDALNAGEALNKPSAAGIGKQEEVNWIAGSGALEMAVTMDNRGIVGHLREIGDNPETENILEETGGDLQAMKELWEHEKDPARRAVILDAMRKVRSALTGDAAAYEAENAKIVDAIKSAVSIAAQIALSLVLPGGGPLLARIALQIGANVATNMAIQGDAYDLAMLRNDILGGVAGGYAGELGKLVGAEAGAAVEAIVQRIRGPIAAAAADAAKAAGIISKLGGEAGSFVFGTEAGSLATGGNGITTEALLITIASAGAGKIKDQVQGAKSGGAAAGGTAAGDAAAPTGDAAAPAPNEVVAASGKPVPNEAGPPTNEAGPATNETGSATKETGSATNETGSGNQMHSEADGPTPPVTEPLKETVGTIIDPAAQRRIADGADRSFATQRGAPVEVHAAALGSLITQELVGRGMPAPTVKVIPGRLGSASYSPVENTIYLQATPGMPIDIGAHSLLVQAITHEAHHLEQNVQAARVHLDKVAAQHPELSRASARTAAADELAAPPFGFHPDIIEAAMMMPEAMPGKELGKQVYEDMIGTGRDAANAAQHEVSVGPAEIAAAQQAVVHFATELQTAITALQNAKWWQVFAKPALRARVQKFQILLGRAQAHATARQAANAANFPVYQGIGYEGFARQAGGGMAEAADRRAQSRVSLDDAINALKAANEHVDAGGSPIEMAAAHADLNAAEKQFSEALDRIVADLPDKHLTVDSEEPMPATP